MYQNTYIDLKKKRNRLKGKDRRKFNASKYGKRSLIKKSPPKGAWKDREPTKECVKCHKEKPLRDFRWYRGDYTKNCRECLDHKNYLLSKQRLRRKAISRYNKKARKKIAEEKGMKREHAHSLVSREAARKRNEEVANLLAIKKMLHEEWVKGGGFLEYIESQESLKRRLERYKK